MYRKDALGTNELIWFVLLSVQAQEVGQLKLTKVGGWHWRQNREGVFAKIDLSPPCTIALNAINCVAFFAKAFISSLNTE